MNGKSQLFINGPFILFRALMSGKSQLLINGPFTFVSCINEWQKSTAH